MGVVEARKAVVEEGSGDVVAFWLQDGQILAWMPANSRAWPMTFEAAMSLKAV